MTAGPDGWPPNRLPRGTWEQDPAYRPTRPPPLPPVISTDQHRSARSAQVGTAEREHSAATFPSPLSPPWEPPRTLPPREHRFPGCGAELSVRTSREPFALSPVSLSPVFRVVLRARLPGSSSGPLFRDPNDSATTKGLSSIRGATPLRGTSRSGATRTPKTREKAPIATAPVRKIAPRCDLPVTGPERELPGRRELRSTAGIRQRSASAEKAARGTSERWTAPKSPRSRLCAAPRSIRKLAGRSGRRGPETRISSGSSGRTTAEEPDETGATRGARCR